MVAYRRRQIRCSANRTSIILIPTFQNLQLKVTYNSFTGLGTGFPVHVSLESWEGAELSEIVALAVSPYVGDDPSRIVTDGPPVRLEPRMALAIAMALQELATNAAKYGGLSAPAGRLSIVWTLKDGLLRLRWEERDGPRVTPPLRRGFGSRLIERSLSAEMAGDAAIEFAESGVICAITARVAVTGEGGSTWTATGYQQLALN